MNWDRILGNWNQLKGIVRQRWGRLTADYAGVVAGKRQHRRGRMQAAHAVALKAEATADAKQLAEWLAREHKADPIHK
jgi:uncharacterized protein YjbJ (UPF0337 family)